MLEIFVQIKYSLYGLYGLDHLNLNVYTMGLNSVGSNPTKIVEI